MVEFGFGVEGYEDAGGVVVGEGGVGREAGDCVCARDEGIGGSEDAGEGGDA